MKVINNGRYLFIRVIVPRAEQNKKEHDEWLKQIARFLTYLHPEKPVIFTGVEHDSNVEYYRTNREILEEWIRKSTPDLHQKETWYSDIEFKFCGMFPWVSIPAMQFSCNIKLVREKKYEGNLVYICYNKYINEWYVFEVNDDLLKAINEVRWISAKEKSEWYPNFYRETLGIEPTEFPPSTKKFASNDSYILLDPKKIKRDKKMEKELADFFSKNNQQLSSISVP